MSLPSVSPRMQEAGDNHFLSRRSIVPGGTLSEMDYMRGWRDDFLGIGVDARYQAAVSGVGSAIASLDDVHGGAVRLTAGAAAGRYARLWLGNAAGGYDSLDADEDWVQIARIRYSHTAGVNYWMGARITPALNRMILVGIDTGVNANYRIYCQDAGGNTTTDSGIAADTDWHVHRMDAYAITGGRQVDYYLDGALIASQTTNVPTVVLTPYLEVWSTGAAARDGDWDYWFVIPR